MDEMPMWRVSELVETQILHVEDGNHGEYRPRPEEFIDSGISYIRAADMSGGVVDFFEAGKINANAVSRIRKGVGADLDVLLSHKGTVGKVAFVPEGSPPFICSPQTTCWRSLDHVRLDPRFLHIALRAPHFLHQLNVMKSSTDMAPYVSLTQQRSMIIPVPQIATQRAIADVLGALDDKIAANARLIDTCDRLASGVFASLTTEQVVVPLSSVAQFINGKAFTKGASGTGRVVVRIAELNSGPTGSTVYSDASVPDQHIARPGDILFAWSGSLTLHRWYRSDAIVNQHIFKVVPNEGHPTWLVWELIAAKLDQFRAIAADKATTMGHIQRRHLDEPVAVPTREALARYDAHMTALWERALAAERENLTLAATRDALLPALMSGRLRVREAERTVEAIV